MKGEENIDVQLRNEFMLQQLISFTHVLDLTDAVGRLVLTLTLRTSNVKE